MVMVAQTQKSMRMNNVRMHECAIKICVVRSLHDRFSKVGKSVPKLIIPVLFVCLA